MDPLTIIIAVIVAIICFGVPLLIMNNYPTKSTLVSYIPTFCTSVGVFCSFLLLWIVLANFNLGNDLGAIVRLLAGKFLFSVVGIGMGIIWSLRIRYKLTQEEVHDASKPYMTKDPQELLWELVGLQDENNEMTKKILKAQYETEITVKNTKDRIVEGLANVSSAVYSANQQQLSKLEDIWGAMTSIGEDTHKQLSGARNDIVNNFDTLNTTINSANQQQLQKLEALLAVMTTAGDYMRQQLGAMINDLKTSLETYIKIMGDQAITITKEQAILINEEFVKLVTELRDNMTDELKKSQELADRIIKTFEDGIKENTDKALEQQKKMAEEFKTNSQQQIDDLKTSYVNLEKIMGNIDANIQQEIAKILQENTENLKATFISLEAMQQRSQTALETSSNAFKEAVDKYSDAHQQHEAIATQLQEQLSLLQDLLNNTRQLYENWGLQEEEMEQMRDRTNTIANMTDNIDQLLRTLLQSTNHQ